MNPRTRILATWSFTAIMVAFACTNVCAAADNNPVRQPTEDVNSPELRRKAGLQPNESLLLNGWGVTPAGDQVPVSDMTLKLVVSPVSALANPASDRRTPRDAFADSAKVKTFCPRSSIAATASFIGVVLPVPAPPRMAVTLSVLCRTWRTASRCSAESISFRNWYAAAVNGLNFPRPLWTKSMSRGRNEKQIQQIQKAAEKLSSTNRGE